MTEDEFAGLYLELIDENPLAIRAVLQVLGIEVEGGGLSVLEDGAGPEGRLSQVRNEGALSEAPDSSESSAD